MNRRNHQRWLKYKIKYLNTHQCVKCADQVTVLNFCKTAKGRNLQSPTGETQESTQGCGRGGRLLMKTQNYLIEAQQFMSDNGEWRGGDYVVVCHETLWFPGSGAP